MNPPKLQRPNPAPKKRAHFRIPKSLLEAATQQESKDSSNSEEHKQDSQVQQEPEKRLKIEGLVFFVSNHDS
jgi:hypothetical protein